MWDNTDNSLLYNPLIQSCVYTLYYCSSIILDKAGEDLKLAAFWISAQYYEIILLALSLFFNVPNISTLICQWNGCNTCFDQLKAQEGNFKWEHKLKWLFR